jgi:hypothetical protein
VASPCGHCSRCDLVRRRIHRQRLRLSDVDRSVYQTLAIRGAELELYSVATPFLAELVARLKRRMVFALGTARARDRLTWPGPIFPGLAIFVP